MALQFIINNSPFIYSINPVESKILIFTREHMFQEHCDQIHRYEINSKTQELKLVDTIICSENIFSWHNLHQAKFGIYFNRRLSNVYKLDSLIRTEEVESPISEVLKLVKFTDHESTILSPHDIIIKYYLSPIDGSKIPFDYTGELPYYEVSSKGNFILMFAPLIEFSRIIETNELSLSKEFTIENTDPKYFYPEIITLYIKKLETFIKITIGQPIIDGYFSKTDRFLIVRTEDEGLVFYNLSNLASENYKLTIGQKFRCFLNFKNIKNAWFSNDDNLVLVEEENSELTLYDINTEPQRLCTFEINGINWASIAQDKTYAIVGLNDSIIILDFNNFRIINSIPIESDFGILSLDNRYLILASVKNVSTSIKVFKISELFNLASLKNIQIINNFIISNFIFRKFNNFVSFDRTGVHYLNCETLEMKSASDLGLRNKKNIKFRAISKNNKYSLYSSIKTVINYDGGFDGNGLNGEDDWRNVDWDDYFYDTEEKYYVICIFNNETKKYLKPIELNHYPLISTDFSNDQNFLFLTFYNGPVYKINLSGWEKLPFKLTSEIVSTKTDAELDELDELRYNSLTEIKNGCFNTIIFSKSTNFFITNKGIFPIDKIFEIETEKLTENIFAPYINQFKNYKIEYSHYEQDYGEEGSVVNKNIMYFYLIVKADTENTFTIQTKSPISYDNIKECYYINEHLLIRRKDDNIIKIPKILERASTFSFENPEYTYEFSSLIDDFALISFVVFSKFDEYVAINDLPNRCIKIFSLQDNKFIQRLDYLSSDINYIIFSEDNKRIITADDEGQILVFSNEDYTLLKKVKLSLTPILFINENKDGSFAVFTQYTVIKFSLND